MESRLARALSPRSSRGNTLQHTRCSQPARQGHPGAPNGLELASGKPPKPSTRSASTCAVEMAASAGDGGLEGFSLRVVELGEAGVGGHLLQDVGQALVHLLEQVDDARGQLVVDGLGAQDLAEDDDDLGQPLVRGAWQVHVLGLGFGCT